MFHAKIKHTDVLCSLSSKIVIVFISYFSFSHSINKQLKDIN